MLTGTVPQGVGMVWIQIKGKRHWRSIAVSHVHGSKFSTRVRVRATAHYKAKAQGALDSNAVKVAAEDIAPLIAARGHMIPTGGVDNPQSPGHGRNPSAKDRPVKC